MKCDYSFKNGMNEESKSPKLSVKKETPPTPVATSASASKKLNSK